MTRPNEAPIALESVLPAAARPAPRSCPDEATLLNAPLRERDAVASHVADCSRCHQVLAALAAPAGPIPGEPLLAAASRIFSEHPVDLLRLAVRALVDRLEVVELVGAVLEPRLVRGSAADGRGLSVHRRIGGRDVNAHVSYSQHGGFAIMLDMGADPRPSRPLRVTVWRDDRELASHVAHDGRAMFPSLRPGAYRMHIERQDRDDVIGRIDLELAAP